MRQSTELLVSEISLDVLLLIHLTLLRIFIACILCSSWWSLGDAANCTCSSHLRVRGSLTQNLYRCWRMSCMFRNCYGVSSVCFCLWHVTRVRSLRKVTPWCSCGRCLRRTSVRHRNYRRGFLYRNTLQVEMDIVLSALRCHGSNGVLTAGICVRSVYVSWRECQRNQRNSILMTCAILFNRTL